MKWTRFSLSVALGLAGLSGFASAGDGPLLKQSHPKPKGSFVGDVSAAIVSDSPEHKGRAVVVGDLTPSDKKSVVGDLEPFASGSGVRQATGYSEPELIELGEASPSDVWTVPPYSSRLSPVASALETACDAGCDSAFAAFRRQKQRGGYLTGEFLLFFAQERSTPPLVSVAPPGTASRLANPDGTLNPNTQVVFGGPLTLADAVTGATRTFGDGLDGAAEPGFRFEAGAYLDDDQYILAGSRFFGMFDVEDDFSITGNSNAATIGVPFFDVNNPAIPGQDNDSENEFLVVGGTSATGTVNIATDLDILGSEFFTRFILIRSSIFSAALQAGYSYHSLEDSLALNTISNPGANRVVTNERIRAMNTFHAGHLGLDVKMHHGRWSLQSVFKTHLGGVHQQASLNGQTTTFDNAGNAIDTQQFGIFTAPSNTGEFTRDLFSFAPEVNLRLGYQLRRNMVAHLGYSFIYWNNMATAGELMDRRADTAGRLLGAPVAAPQFTFDDGSFWLQSIDFGGTLTF